MPTEFFYGAPSFPTRFGTDVADVPVIGTGAPDDLFLQLFGGEVMEHFYASTVMQDKHYRRTISGGKSARFPRLHRLYAEYHNAGQEMLGQNTRTTEVEITLDAILTSHFAIYDLDQAMTHFEVRSVYSQSAGLALAEVYDQNVMRQIVIGARAPAPVAAAPQPFPPGLVINDAELAGVVMSSAQSLVRGAGAMEEANGLIAAFRRARLHLRQNNVPDSMPVYAVISPEDFDLLKYTRLEDAAGTHFGDQLFQKLDIAATGVGLTGMANITTAMQIEGIRVFASNLIPNQDDTAEEAVWHKYRADFTNTRAVIWAPMACGTLELLGLSMEMARDPRRMETFVNASMAVGHGMLRQELNIEVEAV